MNFVIGFPQFTNKKGNNYDLILIIINWLIKTIYYKLLEIIITTSVLLKSILNFVI